MALYTGIHQPSFGGWTHLGNGIVNFLSPEESQIHQRESRLYYGKDERGVYWKDFPYLVSLGDLRMLEDVRFPFTYHDIDQHTQARRTFTGGLKVRRKSNLTPGFTRTATLSRADYEFIGQFYEDGIPADDSSKF